MDDDDETPVLSGSALDALKEFYADRDARLKQFEELKASAEEDATTTTTTGPSAKAKVLSMDVFAEDWNESQFWYSDATAATFARELLAGATSSTVIAVVSAPSVFVQLKNLLATAAAAVRGKEEEEVVKPKLWLLEYDKRFEVFGEEFVFYDFNDPMNLPPGLKGMVDRMIVDPPFLSEDCQTKAAMTVRYLSKSWGEPPSAANDNRLIVCTGERMEPLITKLYKPQGTATTTFEPVHSKGLSNEFFCYANFECPEWTWKTASSS